ncbi:MAG: hypothetical protein FIA94_04405 [Nitrospirae bacterium]|nr:hypothetical protein [Nitrospirota bacterium]
MKGIKKLVVLSSPLLTCYLISLLALALYDLRKGILQKEIYSDFSESIKFGLFDSPPFIIIVIYTYCLMRKERANKEIAIKMVFLLLPITLFSFYWYAAYLPDPLALGFLPFINLIILIPSWLIGIAVNNAFRGAKVK